MFYTVGQRTKWQRVLYVILPFLSWALVRLMRVPEHLRRTYMCMLIFSNNSFMGYPVVEALFGGSAIFYITIFNLPFSILFFSLGLRLLKKDSMVGQESAVQEKISIKSLINVGVVASLAALWQYSDAGYVLFLCKLYRRHYDTAFHDYYRKFSGSSIFKRN